MKGNAFIRKVRAYAKANGKSFEVMKHRGKGSHQTLYVDGISAIIPDPKRELKEGTLRNICSRLSIKKEDL